jgi:VanZ family protein
MQRFKAYLPVLIWMAVIFAGSTDLGSSQRTSRFIGPFLRWFNPEVSEETIRAVQAVVRKGAHLTVYAILAILTWRARRVAGRTTPFLSNWNWRESGLIFAFCALYAITDELHQTFVSTRQGHPLDVMIDSLGALCGLLLIWFCGRRGKRW